jgi:hypothetical protein
MAGLVPAIHVFSCRWSVKTWMPGTRPGMTAKEPESLSPVGALWMSAMLP